MGYLYLVLAIALELVGTTLLKFSQGFTVLFPSIATLVAYGACFFFFSRSLLAIPLSVAYATWSGIGIVFATALSAHYFQEKLSAPMVLGIFCVLVGVLVLSITSAR